MRMGPYELLNEIGRGGMGVVYRARGHDGRELAVKVLLSADASDPAEQRRFQREAEVLASLDHPGILRVRECGVDQGRLYMAMDLLNGSPLSDVVRSSGRLDPAQVTALAYKLALALEHAHAKGIVHRDLKPENVILHGEDPVLVDFGLARLLRLDVSRLTQTGTIMGSPNFMAPEQAKADNEVGPAADVYGLGATLYYLLSGRAPHEGESVLVVLAQVVKATPPALRTLRPDLPDELVALVERCLAKDPAERFVDGGALRRALEQLRGGPASTRAAGGLKSLALVAALAATGVASLAAVAWGGMNQAHPAPPTAKEADPTSNEARAQAFAELGVQQLEASDPEAALSAFNEALRLDPDNLVALANRGGLQGGYFAQPQAALSDYDRLLTLRPDSVPGLTDRGTMRGQLGDYEGALADFERALELEPDNAQTFRKRATLLYHAGRLNEGLADIDRALELDPNNPDSHARRGSMLTKLGRGGPALAAFNRAIELDPNNATAHLSRGVLRFSRGQLPEALADAERVLELEPNNLEGLELSGSALVNVGRFPEAIQRFNRLLELAPDNPRILAKRGTAHGHLSQYRAAEADFTRALELRPDDPNLHAKRGLAHMRLEQEEAAFQDFDRALQLLPGDPNLLAQRAAAQLNLGRFAEALADARRALKLEALKPSLREQCEHVVARAERQLTPRSEAQLQALKLVAAARQQAAHDFEGALATIEHALEVDPRCASAYAARGTAHVTRGALNTGIEDFTRALELDPLHAGALLDRGKAFGVQGRHDLALRDFEAALLAGAPTTDTLVNLGLAQVKLGRPELALASLNRAVASDANDPAARKVRGSVHLGLEQNAQAEADFDVALKLEPGDPRTWGNRGLARLRQGKLEAAHADLSRSLELGDSGIIRVHRARVLEQLMRPAGALRDLQRALELDLPEGWLEKVRKRREELERELERR